MCEAQVMFLCFYLQSFLCVFTGADGDEIRSGHTAETLQMKSLLYWNRRHGVVLKTQRTKPRRLITSSKYKHSRLKDVWDENMRRLERKVWFYLQTLFSEILHKHLCFHFKRTAVLFKVSINYQHVNDKKLEVSGGSGTADHLLLITKPMTLKSICDISEECSAPKAPVDSHCLLHLQGFRRFLLISAKDFSSG